MTDFLDLGQVRKPLPARGRPLRVWRAMRQRRRFTLGELAAICELTERQVQAVIQEWRRAVIVRDDNDGFRLARDLGPQPPFRYGKVAGLVDRRTGEVLPFKPLVGRRRFNRSGG
ncbi:MAG: hypothetical protein K2Y40_12700 [Reyranella sp.]|nr:hypothetical protein [Reyranella sp.]